jgi:serine/threonine-protein kinase RsbW
MTMPALNHDPPIPVAAVRRRRTFPGRPEQAAPIRRFVAVLVAGSPHADNAVQAAAELTANAICHTRSAAPGGSLVVEVWRWDEGRAAVSVTDQGGSAEPHVADLDVYAEHGLGLRLVAATATWWGWRGDATGRTVTAVFT